MGTGQLTVLQVVLEGLAMGLFSRMYAAAKEPVLRRVLKLVMQDESRHFAIGNLSLRRFYNEVPEKERWEREDFAYEVCACLRGRVFPVEAWETIGLPVEQCMAATREEARRSGVQKSAFNRKAARRGDLHICRGTEPSRLRMASVEVIGHVRSAWLARRDRVLARVVSVHRLAQHHLAPPYVEGCGPPFASLRRPSKKENADVAASNIGVFALPGGYSSATSCTPPRCRHGAHPLNGSTIVMLQQARGKHGRCHV
jgi:hypothetical protein